MSIEFVFRLLRTFHLAHFMKYFMTKKKHNQLFEESKSQEKKTLFNTVQFQCPWMSFYKAMVFVRFLHSMIFDSIFWLKFDRLIVNVKEKKKNIQHHVRVNVRSLSHWSIKTIRMSFSHRNATVKNFFSLKTKLIRSSTDVVLRRFNWVSNMWAAVLVFPSISNC